MQFCRRYASRRKRLNTAKIIVLGFLAVILVGAMLLSLPISSRGNKSESFATALFTSVSATCVTGLNVVDTAVTWTVFGQAVILCLLQIGALGFMSVATVFFFVMNKKIHLSQRLLIKHSLNLQDIHGVVRLIRHVIIGTLLFEGLGALVLWLRFIPEYGPWNGLGMGIFHSVSAFCNSGFELMGDKKVFSSLTAYSGDAAVMITVMLLVIVGGLGYFVWEDIWRNRRFRNLHLHSKMVLIISLVLVAFGWIFFYFSERANPATIGNMTFSDKLLSSLFQSVMPRSGGLSVVDQASLTGISKMVLMTLMFIGGSAGSAAGGIKNVTAGILFLSAIRSLTGKSKLSAFGRTIPEPQVVSALSIMIMAMSACFAGTVAIVFLQPELTVVDALFEVVSALATCGLSSGVTNRLSFASMAIIMLLMFLGRIGIMTVGMAAFFKRDKNEKTKYPDTWVMM
jgi:trk system potassium uptake protein TrkH